MAIKNVVANNMQFAWHLKYFGSGLQKVVVFSYEVFSKQPKEPYNLSIYKNFSFSPITEPTLAFQSYDP